MLQSIQYVGSGPPTYVYSNKAVDASNEYYHVFAPETRGYSNKKEQKIYGPDTFAEKLQRESAKLDALNIVEDKTMSLQEAYQAQYGRRALFLGSV